MGTGRFDLFLGSAVSVVILFAAMSWISYKLIELFGVVTNRHGQRLRGELAQCLGDKDPWRFSVYFYWHPMVAPLFQPPAWSSRALLRRRDDREAAIDPAWVYPSGHLPGHISPETFASVVLDPFPWPSTREALSRMLLGNLHPKADPLSVEEVDRLAADLLDRRWTVEGDTRWGDFIGEERRHFDKAFCETVVDVHADDSSHPMEAPLTRLDQTWMRNQLPPEQLRARVRTLLRESEDDVDHFRAAVARWYREAMDRASGRFQRASMLGAFLVAVPICAALNVNLLTIGQGLLGVLGSTPWDRATTGLTPVLHLLSSDAFDGVGEGIHTVVGILLAAAVTALGAPFWYDLLGKISRKTGRGPAPRREERP